MLSLMSVDVVKPGSKAERHPREAFHGLDGANISKGLTTMRVDTIKPIRCVRVLVFMRLL